jgi:uracil-DNA glycosylase
VAHRQQGRIGLNLDAYVDELAGTEPGALLFNPYLHNDVRFDVLLGAEIRQQNLRNYFAGFPSPPRVLLLGEAPGPHGCRFSGVAFTSERQLANRELPFHGLPTSRGPGTRIESSGSIVWGLVKPAWPDVMQWNCVPWHPYRDGEPMSIRTPLPREVDEFLPLLQGFLDRVRPGRILAVGKKAESALRLLDIEATPVRHPANGGATKFRAGVGQALAQLPTAVTGHPVAVT